MVFAIPGVVFASFDGVYEIETEHPINQVALEASDSSIKVVELPEGRPRIWTVNTAPITIVTRGNLIDFFEHSGLNYMGKPFEWTPLGMVAETTINSSHADMNGYFDVRLARPFTDRRVGNGYYIMGFVLREEV